MLKIPTLSENKMSDTDMPSKMRWYTDENRAFDLRIIQMSMEDEANDTSARVERIIAFVFPCPSLLSALLAMSSSRGIGSSSSCIIVELDSDTDTDSDYEYE